MFPKRCRKRMVLSISTMFMRDCMMWMQLRRDNFGTNMILYLTAAYLRVEELRLKLKF